MVVGDEDGHHYGQQGENGSKGEWRTGEEGLKKGEGRKKSINFPILHMRGEGWGWWRGAKSSIAQEERLATSPNW